MNEIRTRLSQLWQDDFGFVASSDLLLIGVILVLGTIVGLTTLRDQVVQELGDIATAIGSLNQSYSYSGTMIRGFTVAGSDYTDNDDDCDSRDRDGRPPACINVAGDASDE